VSNSLVLLMMTPNPQIGDFVRRLRVRVAPRAFNFLIDQFLVVIQIIMANQKGSGKPGKDFTQKSTYNI
jgi:hypothetical protein